MAAAPGWQAAPAAVRQQRATRVRHEVRRLAGMIDEVLIRSIYSAAIVLPR